MAHKDDIQAVRDLIEVLDAFLRDASDYGITGTPVTQASTLRTTLIGTRDTKAATRNSTSTAKGPRGV